MMWPDFVAEQRSDLLRVVRRKVRPQDTEDVVQSAMLRALGVQPQHRDHLVYHKLLRTILDRTVADYYRSGQAVQHAEWIPDFHGSASSVSPAINLELEFYVGCPRRHEGRTALMMQALGFPVAEIAAHLNMKRDAVYQMIHRAREEIWLTEVVDSFDLALRQVYAAAT